MGYLMGRLMVFLVNKLNLGYEGLYPVLTLALAILLYGATAIIGGSGFLALYVAGIVLGNSECVHKKSLTRFHDGVGWLMQVAMFTTLGLFVFPSRLIPIAGSGLLISLWLMFVARPVAVLGMLAPSKMPWREKILIAWVGLRGAAPIILATFPFLYGIPEADLIFHLVFFIVATSVLLQGTSIPLVAKWLGLAAPLRRQRVYPIEFTPSNGLKGELTELQVFPNSPAVGRAIFQLGLPDDFLVILLARGDDFLIPYGGLPLQAGDVLLVLSGPDSLQQVQGKWQLALLPAS
jgi:cell volume regulation protein A